MKKILCLISLLVLSSCAAKPKYYVGDCMFIVHEDMVLIRIIAVGQFSYEYESLSGQTGVHSIKYIERDATQVDCFDFFKK